MPILAAILGTLIVAAPTQAQELKRCPKYEAAIKAAGLPVKTFSYLAWRESRCNHRSISAIRQSTGRPDVGLFQVQASWATVTRRICHVKYSEVVKALTRLDCQLKVAKYLWQDGKGASNWGLPNA